MGYGVSSGCVIKIISSPSFSGLTWFHTANAEHVVRAIERIEHTVNAKHAIRAIERIKHPPTVSHR
jgi:hypothetical protein